jgi:hypothetical protein
MKFFLLMIACFPSLAWGMKRVGFVGEGHSLFIFSPDSISKIDWTVQSHKAAAVKIKPFFDVQEKMMSLCRLADFCENNHNLIRAKHHYSAVRSECWQRFEQFPESSLERCFLRAFALVANAKINALQEKVAGI